jgi:2-polyprenyl-3-methyl-5-hydroxy-6-metoxy-1,4-benzoquinol methylase
MQLSPDSTTTGKTTMNSQHLGKPENYWNRAGEVSYGQAMYSSADVERHVRLRLWNVAAAIADTIGIPRNGHVLDYGCGDGAFANETLAPRYRATDGYDLACPGSAPCPHGSDRADP